MPETLNNITAWKVFDRIVKTGSLSRAAIELDLSVSRASRLLSHLEEELDAQLVNRAVRPKNCEYNMEGVRSEPCMFLILFVVQ